MKILHNPEWYREAATRAAKHGDYKAAARLDLAGGAVCAGYSRKLNHRARAEAYAIKAGLLLSEVGMLSHDDEKYGVNHEDI
jgi:hypothetical protein